ncbi:MAG: hypothetical protein HY821_19405 [Acidobacteria bacterium]|nr:hypothetical protein [Acidobacteriota bacterium]
MARVSRRSMVAGLPALAGVRIPEMPTVRMGQHSVSRLIVGGNPVSANSHVSGSLSSEMRDYFTTANVKRLLEACESAGINAWQSRADRHIMRLLHEYRQDGGKIQWIAQTASEYGNLKRNLGEAAALKPIGIYHHGSQTDSLWQAGKLDQLQDALKQIRQTGMQTGLGTHIPEVVDHAESKGWDVDFYMTCVYNLSRTEAAASQLAGREIKGEYFHDADREEMLKRVAAVRKPCLIFKIYGATRQCATAEARKAAVELAFRYAKPTDAVVVGMFPKYTEQVRENCRLVQQASAQRQN